jgi:hypothetical protein
LKITIIKNRKEWTELLSLIDVYDSYHTYDYHLLSKSDNEIPILIKYEHLDVLIGIPLLVRNICNSQYKDLTSVYGYSGPISRGVTKKFDNTVFINELAKFLKKNNFVSAFSRLNPFIPNQIKILNSFGSISCQGKIVNIDISKNLEIQRSEYKSRLKTYINKSRRNCSIIRASTKENLEEFIAIYYKNMIRVEADDFYFFNKLYFNNLIDSKDFETEILLAKDNETNTIIAGCIFMISNGIVQYHLSGSKTEFSSNTPTKFLIDEMRIIATNKGCNYYNLGGGKGGNINDSLFYFKSAFSKNHLDFNLWKFIINQEVYDELVLKTDIIKDSEYFPLYRSKKGIEIKKSLAVGKI